MHPDDVRDAARLVEWGLHPRALPEAYPDYRELVRRWRQGSSNGVDRANHWAGQAAAMTTAEPAGDSVTRMWDEALRLLP